jgi:hypothetical protein
MISLGFVLHVRCARDHGSRRACEQPYRPIYLKEKSPPIIILTSRRHRTEHRLRVRLCTDGGKKYEPIFSLARLLIDFLPGGFW